MIKDSKTREKFVDYFTSKHLKHNFQADTRVDGPGRGLSIKSIPVQRPFSDLLYLSDLDMTGRIHSDQGGLFFSPGSRIVESRSPAGETNCLLVSSSFPMILQARDRYATRDI